MPLSIPAVQNAPDDFFLTRLEALVTEVRSERLVEVDIDLHELRSPALERGLLSHRRDRM